MTAMICAGLVAAQFIAGKAARDALYLAHLDVTTLPTMVIATSVVSIGLVVMSSKIIARLPPSRYVPLLFAATAVLLLVDWILILRAPRVAVVLVYLQISGLGPMLGSGFWLIAAERFDPRTAKQRFGQIQGIGTVGGLAGSLLAERIAAVFGAAAMLPVLALLNVFCAWQVRQLARPLGRRTGARRSIEPSPEIAPEAARSGLHALREAPYLRNLAGLVLLATLSAALVDYIFKTAAVNQFGRGDNLLRLFAIYYAATSVLTFVVQTSSSRLLLERFGLAFTTAAPSLALALGSIGGLLAPGFASLIVARGSEAVARGSLFRAGYELFYTPIPTKEKRAAKTIIDVGFDRLGDAAGGSVVRLVLMFAPAVQYSTILVLTFACSVTAVVIASRLNRGYIHALEKGLLNRAVELDLSDIQDVTTRTTMLRTLTGPDAEFAIGVDDSTLYIRGSGAAPANLDSDVQDIVALRSRDKEQILGVLRREEGVTAALVPHVIPLLAWDSVAQDATAALRQVAEERVGALVDALIDPNQEFTVRRRLARVFSVCISQRAVDGLMLALDDLRFEVRFHCGRSLYAIFDRNPFVRVDKDRVFELVLREATVGRPVWESRRLLDAHESPDTPSFVDELVRDRAGQSLTHVFTLLSLVLPREPLQIAFRGLHTEDRNLQGTALEYLEGVLPPRIRERLWPYLEDRRPTGSAMRPREEILADLLRSNDSIKINLAELRRRTGT